MAEHKFIHQIDWAKIIFIIVLTFLILNGYTKVDDVIDVLQEKNQLENQKIEIESDRLQHEIEEAERVAIRCNCGGGLVENAKNEN